MKIRSVILAFLLAATFYTAKGDTIYTKNDALILDKYAKEFENQKKEPFSVLIPNTAKFFLGCPYVASTLEVGEDESLVVNLRQFDCTTLVESCIALSGLTKLSEFSIANYCKLLQLLRYRGEEIDGYTSRLHYLSDWIHENEQKKVLKNITADIGGVEKTKLVNYMSTHPQSYKQLKNNADNIRKIKTIENEINERNDYVIIPKTSISKIEKDIQNGDIIAFATTIGGLDYSHVGIAYWEKGVLRFIHASSAAKKVIIDRRSISEYCNSMKTCSGITVLRVNN